MQEENLDQKLYSELYPELKQENPNEKAPIEKGIATLTYKQLAQNFKENTERQIRQTIRRMNHKKRQVQVVNGPGSIIKGPEGTFLITKKGKSIRIGD